MKRKINRIMIICMLIGFCVSPKILKSQLVQADYPIFILLETDSQHTFNKWFSLDYFFEADLSSEENDISEGDSLKNKIDVKSKMKSSEDSSIPKLNRSSSKKIRKKNFRNKPVIIQTRI